MAKAWAQLFPNMLAAWPGHSTAIRPQGALGSPRARDDQNITQRLGVTSPRHFRSPAREEVPGQVMHAVHPGGTARPTRWWGRLASLPCSAPQLRWPLSCGCESRCGVRAQTQAHWLHRVPGTRQWCLLLVQSYVTTFIHSVKPARHLLVQALDSAWRTHQIQEGHRCLPSGTFHPCVQGV